MRKSNILIIALFASASLLRFAEAFRPIDKASWRECDLGAISRNFVQEGMNPFYPRIDWRGDGPGYAEMELPLYPFLTAISYQIFGIHDQLGRLWSFLFSIGTLFFFFRLAREYLIIFPATVAFAFFALNPLIVEEATAVQPEGMMLLAYLGAVYFFVRWLKTEKSSYFVGAVLMTAMSLLAKAPSAHIGLFFGVLLFEKYGLGLIKQGRVWLFGVLSVLPSVIWYFHAKNLWKTYGNSLGVSNEYHWIGWDFFTNADFIEGILRSEFIYVWISFGIVVGAFAIWRGYREEPVRHALLWLASIFALYILAARTTSDGWAYYYHVFSIPPVALLFGFSIKKLWDYAREFADSFSRHSMLANFSRIVIFVMVITAIFASLLLEAKQVRAAFEESRDQSPPFAFAEMAKPLLRSDGLILVSGGNCVDPTGYPVAFNASYMFYWLERKGWNICVEEQSVPRVREFQRKGAVYFVAEKTFLRQKTDFENELRQIYPVTAEADNFVLFDLNSGR
jgi:hypothetical protein